MDLSELRSVGVDETAARRGHNYVSLFVDMEEAEAALEGWYQWAVRSRLEPIVEFARMLRRHWDGILRWFTSKLNNGLLEALNSLVQAAKSRARGYRSVENFKLMIYLIAGHLGLLPT